MSGATAISTLTVLFLSLGGFFLAGLAMDLFGRATGLPRVSLLLLIGFGIGPSGLDLLPDLAGSWQTGITDIALVMVGFLLGERLTLTALRARGKEVLSISICVTLMTGLVVFGGLYALGVDPILAIFLGGIATATDPVATLDVAREQQAQGPFTDTLMGVVAIDDAWGLLLFTLLFILVDALAGQSGGEALRHGLMELGGSLGLGLLLGVPMAYLSGRLRPGEPTQAEALGFACLCVGLALWMDLSFLLAAIALGATVANLARHHQYAFHEIEGIKWPFMILFFILAGASLDLKVLLAGGAASVAFILLRILGRIIGNLLGARLADSTPETQRWLGLALLPQAGVATGMALIAAQRYPQYADKLISLVVGTTVFFEIIGPILTRLALKRSGEAGQTAASPPT